MSDLDLLEKRLNRSAFYNYTIAASGVVFGVPLAAGTVWLVSVGDLFHAGVVGLLTLVFLAGSALFVSEGRAFRPARESVVYKALTGDSQGLAWAHGVIGRNSGVKVYFLDGKQFTIIANRDDSATLLSLVQRQAPHALLGFGDEQEARYRALVAARK